MVLFNLSRTLMSVVYVSYFRIVVKLVMLFFICITLIFGTLLMKAVGDIVENGSESFFFLTIMGTSE